MEGRRAITFRDGSPGIVRRICPSDRHAFVEGFEELSEESRFSRFFFNKRVLTNADIDHLSNPDGYHHIAYGVAAIEEDGSETPISVGHCFRDGDTQWAEVAIVTADLWQGNGAGLELLHSLKEAALAAGIAKWIAVTLRENTPMLKLLEKAVGPPALTREDGDVIEATYQIR